VISVVVISKDEPALDHTLTAIGEQGSALGPDVEVVVVDASHGRLDDVRQRHPEAEWIPYEAPPGVRVSIPQQRNIGVRSARGEIVVFTDANCLPHDGWLAALLAPIQAEGEDVTAGVVVAPGGEPGLYDSRDLDARPRYLSECPSGNIAFRRETFEAVDGFDESFEYGSDTEFSWRLGYAGYRIRSAPSAIIEHDWGTQTRQLRRAYVYGRARARLYLKHRNRLRTRWREDPTVLVYPAFLLGLPLTLVCRLYPALLLIPAWRNRRDGAVRVVADHLVFGVGVLSELASR
jgi:glycosyltransferase involved in cell wall biosynthesis